MDATQIQILLDSCFVAKTITEKIKQLPEGFKPRHIHTIDAISRCNLTHHEVRISDVSHQLNITTPSVTKLINELEEKGVVIKKEHATDKRVVLITLSPLGKELESKYVSTYHTAWAKNLKHVSDRDVEIVVRTLNELAKSMPLGE